MSQPVVDVPVSESFVTAPGAPRFSLAGPVVVGLFAMGVFLLATAALEMLRSVSRLQSQVAFQGQQISSLQTRVVDLSVDSAGSSSETGSSRENEAM